jgi:DNA-binding HxlR family transcriptional regulator
MPDPGDACPCATPRTGAVFALLGKRWTGQLLDLLLQGPARFNALAAALPGLSHRVLAERLTELRQAGLIERTATAGNPAYALTPRGEQLRPAMDALASWCQPAPADQPGDHPAGAGPADEPCLGGRRGVWEAFSGAGERVRDALERRVRNGAGMPPSYFELMIQLRHAPGHRLRMSELAAATRSKPSRITHAVNRLERAGWITRDSHPTDGRGSTAALTEQGVAAMDAARPAYARTISDHVLGPLTSAEQHQLYALCEKILASFDDTAEDPEILQH